MIDPVLTQSSAVLELQDKPDVCNCDESCFLAVLVPGATVVRPNSAHKELLRVAVEVGDGSSLGGNGFHTLCGNGLHTLCGDLLSPARMQSQVHEIWIRTGHVKLGN